MIYDYTGKRNHTVIFRSDLHFTLTQILVNIFRCGYFSHKEDFVGKIAATKNIYENLRESEMKVRPNNTMWPVLSGTVTNNPLPKKLPMYIKTKMLMNKISI